MVIFSETWLEGKFCREVLKRKGIPYKFKAPGRSAGPDRQALMPGGRAWFVEFKTTGKVPTDLQAAFHRSLLNLGYKVRVVDDDTKLMNVLNEIDAEQLGL